MARLSESLRLPSLRGILIVFVACVVALALGRLVAVNNLGVRELAILVLVILTSILVFIPSERVLRLGFVLWIMTFAFGWRTIYLTANLNIHPSEVLAWLLCFTLIVRAIIHRTSIDFSIPILVPVFMIFAFLGLLTASIRGKAPDVALEEFKVFLVLIPSYYVVKWMVRNRAEWERAIQLSVLAVLYVSLLGLLDYFAPSISQRLAGSQSVETLYVAVAFGGASFARVGFIFYGNFLAGFFIFTFFGLTAHLFLKSIGVNSLRSIGLGLVLAAEMGGMYLSGYRGLWYAFGIFLLVYALMNRRSLILLGIMVTAIPLLPLDFLNRFQSVFDPQYADSSQYDRIARAQNAFALLQESPLTGVGWGGSGYVHSDLVQIGANLGLPALGVFVLWIATTLWKLFRLGKRSDWRGEYARTLFATLCGLIVVFAGAGLIVFIQMVIPIWFLFAMAYKLVGFGEATVTAE